LLIKTTEREHSSSVCDFSPTETLTGISVELCPNGNRLWYPEYGDLSFPKIPSGADSRYEALKAQEFRLPFRPLARLAQNENADAPAVARS
jgi:hypothetical protein